jgi:hypothetical protein
VQYTFCIEHSLPDWLDEARMLSVLLLRAVWRGDADDLGFWFGLEGSFTHRQQYPGGVFVFLLVPQRRRGRQVVRQRSAKPAVSNGAARNQ